MQHVFMFKCSLGIVLFILVHVKHSNNVCSVKTKNNANFNRTHCLNHGHLFDSRYKRPLMQEIYALHLTFNHTTVYAHILIACNWTKLG